MYAGLSGLVPAALGGPGCRRTPPPAGAVAGDALQVAATSAAEAARADDAAGYEPAYLALHRAGELKHRGEQLWEIMRRCALCPRRCGVNRVDGHEGFCRASAQLEVTSHHPHFGEERPLVGSGGSGTIFLTHCALRCVFCINWEISHDGIGHAHSVEELAGMMLDLQGKGCPNINVVTPTHYSPHIVLATDIAAGRGLRIPIVYNTCGWELVNILKILDGIVDIYLPDIKYADRAMAAKYSAGAETYPELTRGAVVEMNRQVGTARPGPDGLVRRGVMIRHLVMPNNVGGSADVMRWIAANLPKDTYVNIMSQYIPVHRAHEFPEINRRITREEYHEAVAAAREAGLTNLDIQGSPRG